MGNKTIWSGSKVSAVERQQYTCREVAIELEKVKQFERQIEETGDFDAKTVFGFLGDLGIGNGMAKTDAKKSLRLRRTGLEDLSIGKGCDSTITDAE